MTSHGVPSFRIDSLLAVLLVAVTLSACGKPPAIAIDTEFESGSVADVVIENNNLISFALAGDPQGGERLWFSFRLRAATAVQPDFVIRNPGQAHQHNWDVVHPVFSSDGEDWQRAIETEMTFEASIVDRVLNKILRRPQGFRFRAPFSAKEFTVAYARPYTTQDLERYLATLSPDNRVTRSVIGQSEAARPLHLLTIDQGVAAPRGEIWVVAREHPGETPASLVLEGFIDSLLASDAGKQLLEAYRFKIVPMLNIDGVSDGLYYRNSHGIDLAQDWTQFHSAETHALHAAMQESLAGGLVALVLNLHSANAPKSHFFLETPPDRLAAPLATLQQNLIDAASGKHPQLQTNETVALWDYPEIFGNFLSQQYEVYCLYLESNYSVGADGSEVTTESLRELGASMVRSLDALRIENQLPLTDAGN